MHTWTPHWLEASGDLAPFRPDVTRNLEQAHEVIARWMPPPRLDVLVQRVKGAVIPELGIVGRAERGNLFGLTLDPDNPRLADSLHDGALVRMIVHEVHHCLRIAGPGYGATLGEALVSEGLAGQFVRHLLGTAPEPWERALTVARLRAAPVDIALLGAARYDHLEWFFGTGSHPRWLGYTLGYQMVGSWLAGTGPIDAATWVQVPAATVIASALAEGLVAQAA